MSAMLPSRQLWAQGPHIVAIGGGTGLSTMLRGLKKYTKNLTAIVTVSDDGGRAWVLKGKSTNANITAIAPAIIVNKRLLIKIPPIWIILYA